MDEISAGSAPVAPLTTDAPTLPDAPAHPGDALARAQSALAAARGEAKGLLIAAEMAERACEALRQEVRLQRSDRADLEHGLQMLEKALADARSDAAESARREAEARSSLAAAEADLRDEQARHAAVQALLAATQAELAEARSLLAETRSVLAETRSRLTAAHGQVTDLLTSRSWRITAPVRLMTGLLRRRP